MMKILLIVAGVLLALVLTIVAIGAALPRHHTASRTAFIRATPEQVFGLISGPQDWRTDLRKISTEEEGGRQLIRETDQRGQTITYEVVEAKPPHLLKRTISDKSLPFGGSWTWEIQPQQSGCLVTITEDGEVYNPVFRFVSRFIIGHTRGIDGYLAMLGAAVEARK
jgi:hypothetical protein